MEKWPSDTDAPLSNHDDPCVVAIRALMHHPHIPTLHRVSALRAIPPSKQRQLILTLLAQPNLSQAQLTRMINMCSAYTLTHTLGINIRCFAHAQIQAKDIEIKSAEIEKKLIPMWHKEEDENWCQQLRDKHMMPYIGSLPCVRLRFHAMMRTILYNPDYDPNIRKPQLSSDRIGIFSVGFMMATTARGSIICCQDPNHIKQQAAIFHELIKHPSFNTDFIDEFLSHSSNFKKMPLEFVKLMINHPSITTRHIKQAIEISIEVVEQINPLHYMPPRYKKTQARWKICVFVMERIEQVSQRLFGPTRNIKDDQAPQILHLLIRHTALTKGDIGCIIGHAIIQGHAQALSILLDHPWLTAKHLADVLMTVLSEHAPKTPSDITKQAKAIACFTHHPAWVKDAPAIMRGIASQHEQQKEILRLLNNHPAVAEWPCHIL